MNHAGRRRNAVDHKVGLCHSPSRTGYPYSTLFRSLVALLDPVEPVVLLNGERVLADSQIGRVDAVGQRPAGTWSKEGDRVPGVVIRLGDLPIHGDSGVVEPRWRRPGVPDQERKVE